MKSSGIYVEIPIKASLGALWEHTQNPDLHQQWDLRFTRIEYLPKACEEDPQRFLYETQIGFGLKIAGEGESVATRHAENGQSTSSLKFWSDESISLIEAGSGYWKYIPAGDAIRFLTWYDYQVRFGLPGRLFDRIAFRPLMGWATAWSFDALRLWLEQGTHPRKSVRGALVQLTANTAMAAIWVYQGLVPKLLFPDSGELEILRGTGLFAGGEASVLAAVGLAEILFGVLFLLPVAGRRLHQLNILLLLFLGFGASLGTTSIFVAPFNPVSLTLGMVALSVIAMLNADSLPSARRCLRSPNRK